jgi:hypothetical protein
MPICKKCQNPFPNRALVNGKLRVMCSRKYCLNCSAFGSGNRRKIERYSPGQLVTNPRKQQVIRSVCVRCGRQYEYNRQDRKGHRPDICNSCNANRRRVGAKAKLVLLGGGSCRGCGYCRSLRALSFHHTDPTKKDFALSDRYLGKTDLVAAELKKCVLVCSNCHAEIHEGIRKVVSVDGGFVVKEVTPLSANGRPPGSDPGN